MADPYLNQRDADQEVIGKLINELQRREMMLHLYKLADERVIRAKEVEVLSEDEVREIAGNLTAELADVNALLPQAEPSVPADTPTPAEEATPSEPLPAETPASDQVVTDVTPEAVVDAIDNADDRQPVTPETTPPPIQLQ